MGSQPPFDRSASACAAEAVTTLVPASVSRAAGARWNHESVDVSSIFLITSARDSTGQYLRVCAWGPDDSSLRDVRPIDCRARFDAFSS
jgi:hypothetical protein